MNYDLEITMNYTGLGANLDGSVTKFVRADVRNVKSVSKNVGGGRQEDDIQGTIFIQNHNNDYDDFGLYLNDTTGYYVNEEDWSYKLYINGEQLNTNKIRQVGNDIDNKTLSLKPYDVSISQYTNIFASWDIERNIIQEMSPSLQTQISYTDFRTLQALIPVVENPVINSQQGLDTYVQSKIDEFEDRIPDTIVFSGTGPAYTATITHKQFQAIGYKNGTDNETPSGVDWIYDTDVSSQPRFVKKPKLISLISNEYIVGVGIVGNPTINIEQAANITFTGGNNLNNYSIRLREVIQYLIGEADSSISFNANNFDGLDDIQGETFNSSTDFMEKTWIMPVSNIIPTLGGNKKNNDAERGMMSIGVILNFLDSLGFFWYLEYDDFLGSYEFRLEHITTRTYGTSNPNLNNYKNKDWSYKLQNIENIEDKYEKIVNSSTSGDYHFSQPEFIFRTGQKSISFGETRLITDIDHVVDAKDSIFDSKSGEQWAFFVTTFDSVDTEEIRRISSPLNSITTNNYELSFYYLTNNIMEVPSKVDENGTEYDDDRLQKKKRLSLEIPIDNPQTDFTFYDSVTIGDRTTEIQQIERGIADSVGTIILKFA
jgi:hypothetical protein